MLTVTGYSPIRTVAQGSSTMLVPLQFMNFVETGTGEDIEESGEQTDDIVEGDA